MPPVDEATFIAKADAVIAALLTVAHTIDRLRDATLEARPPGLTAAGAIAADRRGHGKQRGHGSL